MFTLEDGDTGEAILSTPKLDPCPYEVCSPACEARHDKVNGERASIAPDARVKLLVGLSRWERAGMLAWIAASQPDVFDDAAKALGYT